jgi:hypothetical protein
MFCTNEHAKQSRYWSGSRLLSQCETEGSTWLISSIAFKQQSHEWNESRRFTWLFFDNKILDLACMIFLSYSLDHSVENNSHNYGLMCTIFGKDFCVLTTETRGHGHGSRTRRPPTPTRVCVCESELPVDLLQKYMSCRRAAWSNCKTNQFYAKFHHYRLDCEGILLPLWVQ